MRNSFFLSLIGLIAFSFTSAETVSIPEDPNDFHIFLLMGQSNMEGGAALDEPMDTETHPRIFKLNSWGSWELAKDPITNYKDEAVGPGLTFAKKLVEENPDITVGLVPLAVGGTSIAKWSRGTTYYNNTLNAASIARNKGVLKGILWHQGEDDGITGERAKSYATNLKRLINDLRVDLHDVNLPFIVGGFTDSPYVNDPRRLYTITWRRLKLVGTTFYNCGYTRSSEVPYYTENYRNNIHFTTAGQRIMGGRYCDEYLRVAGYWQQKLKEKLDAESTELEDGWKWSPEIGRYYDANYPFIKQAQLGWIYVDGYADGTMNIMSATNGSFKTYIDENEQGWYIYRYDEEDPENLSPNDIYYVWLNAPENGESVFYNHTTETWSQTIDDAVNYDSVNELYQKAEQEFSIVQEQYQLMNQSLIEDPRAWSQVTQALKEMEKHRIFVLLYALEAYQFVSENPDIPYADFWKEVTIDITKRIDDLVIDAQALWQSYSVGVLAGE